MSNAYENRYMNKQGYVYFATDGVYIKIGFSKNPKKRLITLNIGNSQQLYLLGYIDGDMNLEKQLHSKFKLVHGEWFEPTEDLLLYINSHLADKHVDWLDGKLHAFAKMKM
jgi:hypothetical protein